MFRRVREWIRQVRGNLNRYLSAVANVASLVVLAVSGLTLAPGAEQYRGPAILLVSLALCWFLVSLSPRRAPGAQAESVEPRVVMFGGQASAATMDAIASSHLVKDVPFIEFIRCDAAGAGWLPDMTRAAAGAILMPDFTRVTHPNEYKAFKQWLKAARVTVGRYYPDGYAGTRESDFPVIPFHTPDGIVNYVSEFLLAQSAELVRRIDMRWRRTIRAVAACTMSLLAANVFMIQTMWSLERQHGSDIAASQAQSEIVASLHQGLKVCSPTELPLRSSASAYMKATLDGISEEAEDPSPKQLMFFRPSKNPDLLESTLTDGAVPYSTDLKASIAGCSIRHGLAVLWYGEGGRTDFIEAWTLKGEPVGRYDSQTKKLIFDDGSECTFEDRGPADSKRELLCVPVGTPSFPRDASLCLSTSAQTSFMDDGWIRNRLRVEGEHVALFDSQLLD